MSNTRIIHNIIDATQYNVHFVRVNFLCDKYNYFKKIHRVFVSRATIMTLNDSLAENKRQYIERMHYSLQLKEHLDIVRQEAAIQVTKTKDFCECQKNKYSECIQKLEQKLAECRAQACFEFKKRDRVSVYFVSAH